MLFNLEINEEAATTWFTKSKLNYYKILKEFIDFDDRDATSMTGSLINNKIAVIEAGVGGRFIYNQDI